MDMVWNKLCSPALPFPWHQIPRRQAHRKLYRKVCFVSTIKNHCFKLCVSSLHLSPFPPTLCNLSYCAAVSVSFSSLKYTLLMEAQFENYPDIMLYLGYKTWKCELWTLPIHRYSFLSCSEFSKIQPIIQAVDIGLFACHTKYCIARHYHQICPPSWCVGNTSVSASVWNAY